MCGIAGFIQHSSTQKIERISSVLRSLHHRGPDDQGWLLYSRGNVRRGSNWQGTDEECEVALLHRRLSILDLSSGGRQPMGWNDRYYIVFNGEIYNHVELRRELEGIGYKFASHSDTEVLLVAYVQWGIQALHRFIGMFALAIFDIHKRTILLARDYFGIKPLYYVASSRFYAFASELGALLELTDTERRVDPQSLMLYLRHGFSDRGEPTLLDGIRQLPPAHYIEISLDQAFTDSTSVCYWKVTLEPAVDISFEDAARKLRHLFLESICLHLRSDVPIGAALSGGIDSSSIVACMRNVAPDLDIHAISYIADDPELSEERWIDMVGNAMNAQVHKVRPQPLELMSDLDTLLKTQQEPFGSTSVYAQYRVFRLAREIGIKVMLDGQGADELLGGYGYCLSARLVSLIRQRRLGDAVLLLRGTHLRNKDRLWLLLGSADYLLPRSMQKPLRAIVAKELTPKWVKSSWFRERGAESNYVKYCEGPEVLRQTLMRILFDTSVPQLLRYEDRNSMAFSVESRVPFLTPTLAEFLLSLPEKYIIAPDGTSKAVFRHAMRGIVPDGILNRRDKIGFATPERAWLRAINVWVQSIVTPEAEADIPFLDFAVMRREWDLILNGQRPFDSRMWRWLNIIRWSQQLQLDYNK